MCVTYAARYRVLIVDMFCLVIAMLVCRVIENSNMDYEYFEVLVLTCQAP